MMPLADQSLLLDIDRVGDRAVVVGERGHILYSDDFGASWQQALVPTTQMLTAVHFRGKRGWAVGHDGLILVSDDQGATWRLQRDGLIAQQQINLQKREHAHLVVQKLEQQLQEADEGENKPGTQDTLPDISELSLQLEDARLDLEDAELALREPVFTAPLFDVWFETIDHGWAVGAFGMLLTTNDSGEHWNSVADRLGNDDELHLNAVVGRANGHVFIAGEEGIMFRSLDAGETWHRLSSPYTGSWFGTAFHMPSEQLLVFGLRGNLFRSEDFGLNWLSVPTGNAASLYGASRPDSNGVVIVGNLGTVLHIGGKPEQTALNTLPNRLSLGSALRLGDRLILVGQGGVYLNTPASR